MNRFAGFIIASAMGLSSPSLAQEREPLVLPAASAWAMLNDGQRCKMVRNFGSGDQFVQMELRYFNPGGQFQLVAAGKVFDVPKGARGQADDVRFLPSDNGHSSIAQGMLGDGTPLIAGSIYLFSLDFAEAGIAKAELEKDPEAPIAPVSLHSPNPEREAEITSLLIDGPYAAPVILETGAMTAPMNLLRGCVEKLLVNFGVDVEQQKNLANFPIPKRDPYKWFVFGPRGYPEKMLREGRVGSISFRLLVDAKGDVTKCDVLDAAQGEDFSEFVCKTLMKQARFKPARDMDGKPVESFYASTVTFTM